MLILQQYFLSIEIVKFNPENRSKMGKSKDGLDFKNPVIAAQVLESPFVADSYLGHTMPQGKDFIGEKNYLSMDEALDEIRRTKKKVILNIGDSSTSGWDSNIVTQNRDRLQRGLSLLPAFFCYKTYSDYLRDRIGNEYFIINAGVPAHTSLQGARRLPILLNYFKKFNVKIECVTAYYGNNDSVWDHNREDKEWVGVKNNYLKILLKRLRKNKEPFVTRVSADDYVKNMRAIQRDCCEHNVKIIFIEPLTPLYWKPGTRVLNETLERRNYPGSEQIYKLLDEGLELWSSALKENGYSPLKRIVLEDVREKDYIVPRIKKLHLKKFLDFLEETSSISIHISLDRSEDDIRYFIDYCHPIGEANELIAISIEELIKGKQPAKRNLKKEMTSKVQNTGNIKLDIPTTHYTLY